jgi:drug/metabolite transporter (DMT)-like permease
MTNTIGEIAGILASFLYAVNAVFLTRASRQVGAVITNRIRVAFAFLYLIVLNIILFRQPMPFGAGADRWGWLLLSGVIGLALGDFFLFQSYLAIGPRIGTLLASLSTVFGILEAWLFLGETLNLLQMAGIALTLGGIAWVILERTNGQEPLHINAANGVLFGVLAAFGQSTGFVLSKLGMAGDFSPIQGNVIRMSAATLALWLMAVFQKDLGKTLQTLRQNIPTLKVLALAALIGPVLGVSFSLLSVQHAPVGIASILTSLSPIFILPISHFVFKERLGWQAVAGTLLAMIGVTILFLK